MLDYGLMYLETPVLPERGNSIFELDVLSGAQMQILEQIKRRFKELDEQCQSLRLIHSEYDNVGCYPMEQWQQWATSVQNILRASFGENSPQYVNFRAAYGNCRGYNEEFNALKGIFLGAKSDYEGGYAFSVEKTMSGEIFGDFIAMAKHALAEDYKDVAAVLACASLEDTLKRFAKLNELGVEDKALQEVVNALKSKGLVAGAQKTLLDSMIKVRDYAMHANWGKIQPADVNSVIGYVEQFLLSNFS
jgi:hypothetical protein